MGKPLQNRPIAPASGSLGMLPGHLAPSLVASSMQGFGAGHPLLASMMRMPQPAFSHVPAGAAAGALAGVTPRNTSLRTPTMPSAAVKPVGLASQAHSSGAGQSQTHAPVTTGSSRPSSPGTSSSHLATIAVATSMHQPGAEHKAGEVREARPTLMSDLARRGASPTVQSMGAAHPPASVGNKVISIVPSAPLPQSHPVQKPSVATLPPHHPSSAHGSGPAAGVGASVSSSMPHMPPAAVGMSGHSQQSKMLPSNTVSVTPAMLTTTAKVYTPPHHLAFTAPRQPPISSSDSTMVCPTNKLYFDLDHIVLK